MGNCQFAMMFSTEHAYWFVCLYKLSLRLLSYALGVNNGFVSLICLGVQVDYNVVHLQTSLVQLFALLLQNFEKVVQMIELKRFGGAPNGYPFAPLNLFNRSSCTVIGLPVTCLEGVWGGGGREGEHMERDTLPLSLSLVSPPLVGPTRNRPPLRTH
jgi:hypothetical protein